MAYRKTYPKNYSSISISKETHQRVTNLRDKFNEDTYDVVINKIMDLEEKYTSLKNEVFEYEYIIKNGSKLFQITYSDTVQIKYYNYNDHQYEDDIRAWFTGERISDEELANFVSFIVGNSNITQLYEMKNSFTSNGTITIKRVSGKYYQDVDKK